MKISSIATIGTGLTIKREKQADKSEKIIAHLKFTDLFVSREEMDSLCGQPDGWARGTFFDDLGAPVARLELSMPYREMTASVKLDDGKSSEMHMAGATLSGIALYLDKSGALLSGQLSWEVAGDEASDAEAMLGQDVRAEMHLTDGDQGDLLRTGKQALDSLKKSLADSGGGSLSVIGADGQEEVLLKVDGKKSKAA